MSSNWQSGGYQQRISDRTYETVQQSGESIQRSLRVAVETEEIAQGVLGELENQHESLLRTSDRLDSAEDNVSKSRQIINRLRREVLYNRIILIAIIFVELLILVGVVLLKFVH